MSIKTWDGLTHVPIKGTKIVRDLHSKALVSQDLEGLKEYRDKERQMTVARENQDRLANLECRLVDVETGVNEIKGMLQTLVARSMPCAASPSPILWIPNDVMNLGGGNNVGGYGGGH